MLLIFCIQSCIGKEKCIKLNISKEELGWFESYIDGDTIFFSNEKNEVDTFFVFSKKITNYTSCNPFELGPYQYGDRIVNLKSGDKYEFSKWDNGYFMTFDMEGKDTSKQVSNKAISFFDLRTGTFETFDKVPKEIYKHPKTNHNVTALIYTEGLGCSNIEGSNEIMQEFAISKEYGLVWYKTIKGEKYERIW